MPMRGSVIVRIVSKLSQSGGGDFGEVQLVECKVL